MQIIHKINDFLFTIFPELRGGGNNLINNTLEKYYTYGPYKPKVTIENNWVTITIDTSTIITQENEFRKVVSLCEQRKYQQAKPLLQKLIEKNPTISEYHRIMGQILSDEGDQEEAVNCLIDALRWDSKNGWALLMMGNIFAKYKEDVPTAMKYYDQALIANPNDNITINNIGANLMQQGKLEEAKKYFYEALKINTEYSNTHFALGMIAEMENDLHSAFYSTIQAIKLNKTKDVLFQNSVKQAFEIAKKISTTNIGKKIYREYRHKLEFEGGREIDIVQDSDIPTAAKMEFAENYERLKHLVKYKPSYPAVEHLVMHELAHIDLVIEARKEGLNQLFISSVLQKERFLKSLDTTFKKLSKMGVNDKAIETYGEGLFNGLNSQAYNTPIDLFIENKLYNTFAELRPFQFISLYNLMQEAIKAVSDKSIIEISPKEIVSKSKVYNLVMAMQFKELFGLNLIPNLNASLIEMRQAEKFYNEFLEYKINRQPAEEYELVKHWAEDLELDKYFELVDEVEYRKNQPNPINSVLASLNINPFDEVADEIYKEEQSVLFQKGQEEIGTNMAVTMFMVDALQYFKDMPTAKIKQIAFEIAQQGVEGYNPDKEGYLVKSISNKSFSGYHILAYYYISWSLAVPESLSELKLPYEEEYKLAKTMHKP